MYSYFEISNILRTIEVLLQACSTMRLFMSRGSKLVDLSSQFCSYEFLDILCNTRHITCIVTALKHMHLSGYTFLYENF